MANITKNFTWEEMERSVTAKNRGYDNSIPDDLKGNMKRLVEGVLQPLRDKWGAPIVVGSGYRCPKLNRAVGGVASSQHMQAAAADIHALSDKFADNKKLYDLIVKMAKAGELKDVRQIIWEYGKKDVGPDWIHISVNDSKHARKINQLVMIGAR